MSDTETAIDLILSAGTVRRASLVERIDAAAAAGFTGIGLRPDIYRRALADGHTPGDLRRILDDRGVKVAELEVLWDWALDSDASRAHEQVLYEMSDAVGGRHLIVNSELPAEIDLAIERFAALCDRGAEHGLLIVIEFLPWTTISDAGVAWRIAEAADRPNGGVLVDSWHHYRGAADDDLIRAIPGEKIMAVHFNDADAEPVGDLLHDTVHNRRVPGHGSFDLVRFVRLLDEVGVTAPFSVEVLSDSLVDADPVSVALEVGEATRRILASARG